MDFKLINSFFFMLLIFFCSFIFYSVLFETIFFFTVCKISFSSRCTFSQSAEMDLFEYALFFFGGSFDSAMQRKRNEAGCNLCLHLSNTSEIFLLHIFWFVGEGLSARISCQSARSQGHGAQALFAPSSVSHGDGEISGLYGPLLRGKCFVRRTKN